MKFLMPNIDLRLLPRMLAIALVGALVAGTYGVFHDQVTYSISPEYFTQMKFHQFAAADFGFPERVLAGEIGFLGTWWVGLISGWFLARIAVPTWPARQAWRMCLTAFCILLVSAVGFGVIGSFFRPHHFGLTAHWRQMCLSNGVGEVAGFVQVAYIHYGGYLGGVLGLVMAIYFLEHRKKRGSGPRIPSMPTTNSGDLCS